MKITKSILTILFFATLTSCSSDGLSISKAESIFIACQGEENHIKTHTSTYGIMKKSDRFKKRNGDFIESYKKLEKEGLYIVGDLQRVKSNYLMYDSYEVNLTPKAKEFLISAQKNYNGEITGKFRICEYTFGSIEEVHEVPDKNIANVKIKIVRVNETPFFRKAHEKTNPKEILRNITYRKTTDGWKFCDKK
jgi:hypothetical protein